MATASMNPFPGLRPFGEEEDYLFFGREDQTNDLLKLLRTQRFLAVVGTSGSGKSSLVRAGMLPALYGGTMAGVGSDWETVVFRPGGDPLLNLAEAMIAADLYDPEDAEAPFRIRATLSRSRQGLVQAVEYSDLPRESNLLIVVDQFEELFRYRGVSGKHQEQASAFVKLLLNAARTEERSIYVVITMRSDYLGDCAHLSGLAEAVNDGKYLIPKLTRDQRRDAIVKPAAVGGGKISESLVQQLLNDVGEDADQLPILQHALMRIWDFWQQDHDEDEPVTLRHYDAVGGIANALSNHADEVYDELPTEESRGLARKVFQTITERGGDERGIRRPTRMDKLCEIVAATPEDVSIILDAYRQVGRTFVMPLEETEITAETVVDISHESLMRVWRRLSRWVEEESQNARVYTRLAETASLYHRDLAGVYRDPDLAIALSWREQAQPNGAWAGRYREGFTEAIKFLEKSYETTHAEEIAKEEARERELEQAKLVASLQARAKKRLSVLLGCIALALIVAVGMYFDSQKQRDAAEANRIKAEQSEGEARRLATEAEASETEAKKQAELAAENAKFAQQQAEVAEEARMLAKEQAAAAEEARKAARRSLYFSEIFKVLNDPDENLRADNKASFVKDWGPQPKLEDLRGWEWYYFASRPSWVKQAYSRGMGDYSHITFSDSGKKFFRLEGLSIIEQRDLETGDLNHRLFLDYECSVLETLADSKTLIVGGRDGVVRLISSESGIVLHEYFVFDRAVQALFQSLQLSRDQNLIYVATQKSGFLIDLTDNSTKQIKLTGTTEQEGGEFVVSPEGCVLGPQGDRLIAIHGGSLVTHELNEESWQKHEGQLNPTSVAWSPDGSRLAIGRSEGKASILNADDLSEIMEVSLETEDPIVTASWASAGEQIVLADANGRQFGVEVKKDGVAGNVIVLPQTEEAIFDYRWGAEDDVLAISCENMENYICPNPFRREKAAQLEGVVLPNTRGRKAFFTKDDQFIIAASNTGLKVISRLTGEIAQEINGTGLGFVVPSPDGKHFVVGGYNRVTNIYEIGTWEQKAEFLIPEIGVVEWSPDGSKLAIGRVTGSFLESSKVSFFDVSDLQKVEEVGSCNVLGSAFSMSWNQSGDKLVVAGQAGPESKERVFVIDTNTFELVGAIPGFNTLIYGVEFVGNKDRFITSGTSGLDLYDLSAAAPLVKSVEYDFSGLLGLDVTEDGLRAIVRTVDGKLLVYDTDTLTEIIRFEEEGEIRHLEWKNESRETIAAVTSDGELNLWSASDGYHRFGDAYPIELEDEPGSLEQWNTGAVEMAVNSYVEKGDWESATEVCNSFFSRNGGAEAAPIQTNWWLSPIVQVTLDEPTPLEESTDVFGNGIPNAFSDQWKRVDAGLDGTVDLISRLGLFEYSSVYALCRVYVPTNSSCGVFLSSDDYHRLWVNGEEVDFSYAVRPVIRDSDFCQVDLQQGWNTFLLKIGQLRGQAGLQLRVTADKAEIVRGLMQEGDYLTANKILSQALLANPDNDQLRYQRTQIGRHSINSEVAINDIELLLENQDSPELRRWHSQLLARNGNESTLRSLEMEREKSTSNIESLFQLASLYRKEQPEKADELYLEIMESSNYDYLVVRRAMREMESTYLVRSGQTGGVHWRISTQEPESNSWTAIDFDDSQWDAITNGAFKRFGGTGTAAVRAWARTEFYLDEIPKGNLGMRLDDGSRPSRVYINGVPVQLLQIGLGGNERLLGPQARSALREGRNVLSFAFEQGSALVWRPNSILFVHDRPKAFGTAVMPVVQQIEDGTTRARLLAFLASYSFGNKRILDSMGFLEEAVEAKWGERDLHPYLPPLHIMAGNLTEASQLLYTFINKYRAAIFGGEDTDARYPQIIDILDEAYFMELGEGFHTYKREYLDRILERNPSAPLFNKAEKLLLENQTDEAVELISQVGDIYHTQILQAQGIYLRGKVRQGEFRDAFSLMRQHYQLRVSTSFGWHESPKRDNLLAAAGLIYNARRMTHVLDIERVTKTARETLDAYGFMTRAYANMYLGFTYNSVGQYELASQALKTLLQDYLDYRLRYDATPELRRIDTSLLWLLAKVDVKSLPAKELIDKVAALVCDQREVHSASWQPVDLQSVGTLSGGELLEVAKGTVKALGETPDTDIYKIRFNPTSTIVTGIEVTLEADLELPSGGPGRHSNGNVHTTDIKLFKVNAQGDATELQLDQFSVSFGQINLKLTALADGPSEAWGVSGNHGANSKAVANLLEPVSLEQGESLSVHVEFMDEQWTRHVPSIVSIKTNDQDGMLSVPEYIFVDAAGAVDAVTAAALVMYRMGDYEKAETYVLQSDADNNLSLYGWILLANLEKRKGDLTAAAQWYSKIQETSERWANGETLVNSLFDEYHENR